MAFSPNGRTLAAGDFSGTIRLWSLPPDVLTANGPVNSVAFSPEGCTLPPGSEDRQSLAVEHHQPSPPHPARPPADWTDGRRVLGGVQPGRAHPGRRQRYTTVWLWNITNPAHPTPLGQPLTGPTGPVHSVTFSPNGRTLAAGSGDSTVRLWNLDIDDAIQRICATASRTLTPAKWDQLITELPYDPPCAHPGHYGLLVH